MTPPTIYPAAKLLIDMEMPDEVLKAPERLGLDAEGRDYLFPLLRVVFFCGYLTAKREATAGRLGQLERKILEAR